MDFVEVCVRGVEKKGEVVKYDIYPVFIARNSKDLMIKGGEFYAIWDSEAGLWSLDFYRAIELIDKEIGQREKEVKSKNPDIPVNTEYLKNFENNRLVNFNKFIKNISDHYIQLDENLTFADEKTIREDYRSRRLSYSLKDMETPAYDEIIDTLYFPLEKEKIEWMVGAAIAGDNMLIQKFLVFYGAPGCGKSSILKIISDIFEDYCIEFKAASLGSSNDRFGTAAFKNGPLIAIDEDAKLDRIEDNTTLNKLVAHDTVIVNEKFVKAYPMVNRSLLLLATNNPVKITDSKSGLIRRLIIVEPSKNKIEFNRFQKLMKQVKSEIPGIAKHCLDVYQEMGPNAYDEYRPALMMERTDIFYNFVLDHYQEFKEEDKINLSDAYKLYKAYCDETGIQYKMPRYIFKDELKSYFKEYYDSKMIDGMRYTSVFVGFRYKIFSVLNEPKKLDKVHRKNDIEFKEQESFFDKAGAMFKAQYANGEGLPMAAWATVTTCLADIITSRLHYVMLPPNHIVIDFDLRDENGEKSLDLNMAAASKWPETYAELSKSGAGIHLHYIYDGDPEELSSIYAPGIEIKVFKGNASLRRKLTLCNDLPIAHISKGLPRKEKKVIDFKGVENEKHLRTLIAKALNKEIHASTKSNIDFIDMILDKAYKSGMVYSLTDMMQKVIIFASQSTNNADYCLKKVSKMHFQSEGREDGEEKDHEIDKLENRILEDMQNEKFPIPDGFEQDDIGKLVFYDIEIFKNLFVICCKPQGKGYFIKMINPSPAAVRGLFGFKLVGFNCRRYDNHILYAAGMLGWGIDQLYSLSQKIINGEKGKSDCFFANAYNISYIDVYEMSSKKQSLKKFEIELGLKHNELGLKWDEPAPKELWNKIVEYCCDDVDATEKVFEARKQDYIAREIIAEISGLPVNATTQNHTAKIIFGDDPYPQDKFVYTDLSEMFPGYEYKNGVSTYRGEEVGEGGYVYAEPGMYCNVALLDIASMHPTSLINLNHFGPYTDRFKSLLEARLNIKHHNYDIVRNMFDGKLAPYLEDESQSDALAYALKIVINIVYGMTSAKFENKFRMPENIDNIVAKRGALFMVDLKHEVQKRGFVVAHIKTDSIKIPNATDDIIQFVMDFGKQYGYTFEHEATYDKMCLVNDAVYIARYKGGKHDGQWTATGKQFAVPYLFKSMFSHEPIEFKDLCETYSTNTALYLVNPDDENDRQFVGKVGSFCPMYEGSGGKYLMREEKDGRMSFASGTKGYLWLESETVKNLGLEDMINIDFYRKLVDQAKDDISKYGDVDWFMSDEEVPSNADIVYAGFMNPPQQDVELPFN